MTLGSNSSRVRLKMVDFCLFFNLCYYIAGKSFAHWGFYFGKLNHHLTFTFTEYLDHHLSFTHYINPKYSYKQAS